MPSEPGIDRSTELRITVAATPENATRVRRQLQSWLISIDWPLGQRADIVLAAHEAVTNAVDHAYPDTAVPGPVRLTAGQVPDPGRRRRYVVTVVTDEGRWREPPARPGHRGRGLTMIHRCMDRVRIEPTDEGTGIVMQSRPVPLDPRS